MRYLFEFLCVCALGLVPLVGCGDSTGDGFPCTEQGIRDAIAEGGGPHTFACDGPQTVVTESEIIINNDVILDAEGKLKVDGNESHPVFRVELEDEEVVAELRGFTVTGGDCQDFCFESSGIINNGTLTLTNVTVSGNSSGIRNSGTLTLTNTTVSDNVGASIHNESGRISLTNSTVSGNGNGLFNIRGMVTITNSTISGNVDDAAFNNNGGTLTVTNTLVVYEFGCAGSTPEVTSNGHNIESPGNTCGFDSETDQVSVALEDLNLGPLADNGGPTMTHALGPGSFAIDRIPAAMCEVDEDQRNVERPQGPACDVGAFELEQ